MAKMTVPARGAEKGPRQDDIDRQLGGTGHERRDEDGEDPVLFTLQGPGRHHRRHVAPEAHEHGDEGFAVEADQVHDLVHEKSGPGHVAGVFENSDEEKKEQDVGEENDHGPHAGDNPVQQKVPREPLGKNGGKKTGQEPHPGFDPFHGVGPRREGDLEHEPDEKDENRKAHEPVGQHPVDVPGDVDPPPQRGRDHLFDNAGDEPVSLVGHDDLGVVVVQIPKGSALPIHRRHDVGGPIAGRRRSPVPDHGVVSSSLMAVHRGS